MASNNAKLAGVGVLACAALGLGAWQARSYFTPRPISDAGARPPEVAGAETETTTTTDGVNRNTNWSEKSGGQPTDGVAVSPAPEVPTQFVTVPSKPESAQVLTDAIPQVAQAVKANVELGQATGTAQNALVAAAMEALSKILGVSGTPADAMGERTEPPPSSDPASPNAVPAGTVAAPGAAPDRGAMFSGLTALLKDASIDASRATVEFFPDGAMGLPKRPKGEPRPSGSNFQATMRMSGRMFSGEKRPTAEVRIPVKIKDSPGPGDDLDIGVMLERDDSGEKWTSAGFNLHMKKPEIMKKMSGSIPAGGQRQAPQAAPGGEK